MRACAACGVASLPYESRCDRCGRPLRAPEEAEARRREWESLEPALRAELEEGVRRQRRAYEEHVLWLRRNRRTHCLIGAGVTAVLIDGPLGLPSLPALPIHLLLGAAAALTLNLCGGGMWRGFFMFVGAGVAAVMTLLPFIDFGLFARGGWFLFPFAIIPIAAVGYYLGMRTEFDPVER